MEFVTDEIRHEAMAGDLHMRQDIPAIGLRSSASNAQ